VSKTRSEENERGLSRNKSEENKAVKQEERKRRDMVVGLAHLMNCS
jgi:hypothetical protein